MLIPVSCLLLLAALQLPRLSLEVFPGYDNCQYFLRAQAIATGQGFVDLERYDQTKLDSFVTPPLLPIALALPMLVFGPTMATAKMTLYLLLIGTYILVFFVLERVFDQRLAWFVVLIQAFSPYIMSMSSFCLTDVLFMNLSTVAFAMSFLLVKGLKERCPWYWYLLLGLFIGSLMWLRYAGLAFAIATLAMCGGPLVLSRARHALGKAVCVALGAFLAVAALLTWVILQEPGYIHRYTIQPIPGGASALASESSDLTASQFIPVAKSTARHALIMAYRYAKEAANGRLFARKPEHSPVNRHNRWMLGVKLTTLTWLALAIVGMWHQRGQLLVLASIYVSPYIALVFLVTFFDIRYLLPILPISGFFVFYGLRDIGERLGRRHSRSLLLQNLDRVFLSLTLSLFVVIALPTSLHCFRNGADSQIPAWYLDYRDVCKWVNTNGYPQDTVLLNSKYPTGRVFGGLRGERPWCGLEGEELTRAIAAYDRALLVHDAGSVTAWCGLPEWLDEHGGYLTRLYTAGSSTVYEVEIDALRSLLSKSGGRGIEK